MTNYYELQARFDTRQSFYGKAHIKESTNNLTLISYETEILKLNKKNNKIVFICKDIDLYTYTTLRHVKEFLRQFTNIRLNTKQDILKYAKIK